MGGGGGSYNWNPQDLARQVREAEKQVQSEAFQTELSGLLTTLLARFNDRDTDLVRRRLDSITNVLEKVLQGKIDQIFGGSVAKHTYVDGLSDVDCLMILNDTNLGESGPQVALKELAGVLSKKLKTPVEISTGQLAVTLRYDDGMELQLLPAVRTDSGLKIPSSRDADRWSHIDPQRFQQALTRRNNECNGKLVPTIKLAKAIIGQLPAAQQLSGYHVESLAIDAFRGYDGPKIASAMLPYFFEKAKERVLTPMTDSTGQSVHVDAYMGNANSAERINAGHILGRIAKRMANASAVGSLPQWNDLFGVEE